MNYYNMSRAQEPDTPDTHILLRESVDKYLANNKRVHLFNQRKNGGNYWDVNAYMGTGKAKQVLEEHAYISCQRREDIQEEMHAFFMTITTCLPT